MTATSAKKRTARPESCGYGFAALTTKKVRTRFPDRRDRVRALRACAFALLTTAARECLLAREERSAT